MDTTKKGKNVNSKKTKQNTTSLKRTEKEYEKTIEQLEKNIKEIEKQKKIEKEIVDEKQRIKDSLQSQLISQGKFGKHFDDMIEDYLYLFDLKEKLKRDLDDNGIRYRTTGGNGFTTYKPNESCERLLKTNAQMLKILQDLDLKTPDEGGGDKGDDLL